MNFLLVCIAAFDHALQYRVLRCAAELAERVYVVGGPNARRLASSRFCTRFIPAGALVTSTDPDEWWRELDRIASAHDVSLVIPGDGKAVRLMSQLRPLRTRTFPVPDTQTFDLLNDKWRFGELCRQLDVPYPMTRVYRDRQALNHDLSRGSLKVPLVLKPPCMAGGRGVHILRSAADLHSAARRLRYAPILSQSYIEGSDISLSAYCRAGHITHSVVYRRPRGDFFFTTSDEFLHHAARLLQHVAYNGVVNFDARLDRAGRIHIIDCNPRFFFAMDMSLLAGLNFVALEDENRDIPALKMGAVLKSNRSLLRALRRPWSLTALDLMTLRYRLRDPIPIIHEQIDRLRDRLLRRDASTAEADPGSSRPTHLDSAPSSTRSGRETARPAS